MPRNQLYKTRSIVFLGATLVNSIKNDIIFDLEKKASTHDKRCQEFEDEIILNRKWQDEKEKKYERIVKNMLSLNDSIHFKNTYIVCLNGLTKEERKSEKMKCQLEKDRKESEEMTKLNLEKY